MAVKIVVGGWQCEGCGVVRDSATLCWIACECRAEQDTSSFANFKIDCVIRTPQGTSYNVFREAFLRFLQETGYYFDGKSGYAEGRE